MGTLEILKRSLWLGALFNSSLPLFSLSWCGRTPQWSVPRLCFFNRYCTPTYLHLLGYIPCRLTGLLRACTYYAAQTVVLLHNTLSRARGGGRGSSGLLAKGSPGDTKGGQYVMKILEKYRKSMSRATLSIPVCHTYIYFFSSFRAEIWILK